MKKIFVIPVFVVAMLRADAQLKVGNLRCSHLRGPMGVTAAAPPLSWELTSHQKGVKQTAYRVWVSEDSAALGRGIAEQWDSRKQVSNRSIQVSYKGKPLRAASTYFWKVQVWDNKGNTAVSGIHSWQMGLISAADWEPAQWIAYENLPDSQRIVPAEHGNGKKEWGKRPDILPLFRKSFALDKEIRKAMLFISGLGQFELHINGEKTGDHFLDPGWTKFDQQALYVSFDITPQLKKGMNAIAVMLGNGFYYIPGERYRKMTGAYGYPKMIAKLQVEYADGSRLILGSDESWSAHTSPITYSSIYGGENYDATLEEEGWDLPGFDDKGWKKAVIASGHPLVSQLMPPVKVMQEFIPAFTREIRTGTRVYDFGQNMSGIPFIELDGQRGDTVRITAAELLKEDGTVNQRATGSPSYFQYICKGGSESWSPRFTYTGFRYAQVEILPGNNGSGTKLRSIKALHTRNSTASTGSFTCDLELFNQTHQLISWAIRSNMQSLFTDCPHRERLGWQEQLHLMGNALQHQYDIHAIGKKIMADIRVEQNRDGLVPSTIPEYTEMHFANGYFRDSPEWGSNVILLPWNLYRWYGDREELELNYPAMQRYLDYLASKDSSRLLMYGLSDWYDLGPQRPGFCQLTPMGLTATAYYYHDLVLMSRIAGLLGKPADASQYKLLSLEVKQAFNRAFFDPVKKQYGTGSQTSNAVALSLGLVSKVHEKQVLKNLVDSIVKNNYTLTSGDIGFHHLLTVLSAAGRDDIIYKMNNRSDVPGYGYQLKKGATALTESWQGLPVVSNNHFMLGHLMDWFYTGLAGIRQAESSVAFQTFQIRPVPVGEISEVKVAYHSVYGPVRVNWKKKNGLFELDLEVPVNTEAWVYLPGDVRPVRTGSGTYHYTKKINQ